MAFFRVIALAILVATADGCVFFSTPAERPPVDGGADLCIASLDPQGRPCCLDPNRGQCPP